MENRAERIVAAKRAGLLGRLTDVLGSSDRAAALLGEYEDQAAAVGLSPTSDAYWAELEPWLARHVAIRQTGAA
jgi:hypothetical protein